MTDELSAAVNTLNNADTPSEDRVYFPPEKKKFDFTHPDFKKQCPANQEFLLNNYDKPITEEEFVAAVQAMPKHYRWFRTHCPSAAKKRYHKLKNNYGLFA